MLLRGSNGENPRAYSSLCVVDVEEPIFGEDLWLILLHGDQEKVSI